jgi:APA family basic amino acid/polyamine antiporter
VQHPEQIELKRALNLAFLTLYGLGTILGAGIYVLVGKVAGIAGLYAPVAFLVAAAIAAVTAFSYAELASRLPKSAGEAVYVQEGFGARSLSIAVGLLLVVAGLVSSATLANGFVGYLNVFVELPAWLVITLLVAGLGGLATWGIAESAMAAAAATLIEMAGLVLIVAVSTDSLATFPARLPELLPPFEPATWTSIAAGAFLAFYAFIGFEDMVNVAEEVKEPRRTLPQAIILAMAISTVLYLLVATAAVLALPLTELASADAPLALIFERATGQTPAVIALIGLFAVVNGALVQIIMCARVLYGMSEAGWLPRWLKRIHARRRTPHYATALVTLAVLALALWLPLVTLAKATSYTILVVFALINAALLRIKRRGPGPPGVRTYPMWIPAAGCGLSVAMLAFQTLSIIAG